MQNLTCSIVCIVLSCVIHGRVYSQDTLPVAVQPDSTTKEVAESHGTNAVQDSSASAAPSDDSAATQSVVVESNWRLQLLCERTQMLFQDISFTDKYNVRPGTQGALLSIHEGRIEFTCTPKEEDYASGTVVLNSNPSLDSISLSSYDECDTVYFEIDKESKLARLTVIPARISCRLTMKTGVVDYTLIRTDENGEISDTFFNVEADHPFILKRKHNYSFLLTKPGFDPYQFPIAVSGDTSLTISQFKPKNLTRMVTLSLLFPGNGQFYGDRPKAGTVYRVLGVTLLAMTVVDGAVLGISKLRYDNYNEQYKTEPNADERKKIRDSRASAKRMFYRSRTALYGITGTLGLVWTINIVDPFVFSIRNKTRL